MPRRRARDPLGKLKAVARRWASGRGGRAARSDDALTAASPRPAWRARVDDAEAIELPGDDAEAAGLFLALDTQWSWHPMVGARIGLKYEAVPAIAGMMGIEMTPRRFADLKSMEAEALATFASSRR